MAIPACEECRAIYRELLELVELSRRTKPGPGATAEQLVEWLEQQEADEDYQMRVRPALSALTRRWIDHKKRTGHFVQFPLPPGGLNSRN
jgi:hypothetical protein